MVKGLWSPASRIARAALVAVAVAGLLSHSVMGWAQEDGASGRSASFMKHGTVGSPPGPGDFHRSRRELVLRELPADAVAIVLGSPTRNRSGDVDHPYRQSSDLLYLTGSSEPGSALVLVPGGVALDGDTVTEVLFLPAPSPHGRIWTGRRLSPAEAESELGISRAVEVGRFEEIVAPLLESHRLVTLPLPRGVDAGSDLSGQIEILGRVAEFSDATGMEQRLLSMLLSVDSDADKEAVTERVAAYAARGWTAQPGTQQVIDAFLAAPGLSEWRAWKETHYDGRYVDTSTLRQLLDRLRSEKTEEELELLRRAIDITTSAHREAFRSAEPGMHEFEIEAVIGYVFRREGATGPAFPSIVGSGENSLVLHYDANRRRMQAGDVVVMDIGAEYGGYAADVTRTIPVSGVFSAEQRAVYEIVLAASEAAIQASRSGESFWTTNQVARAVVADGLVGLGLLADPDQVTRFLPHPVSHYLGLDVHDVGPYGPLQPGNVITVEPGIYIRPADDIDPKWWNIGVRIEDDVLITEGEPVLLSGSAPRTVAAIEKLMRETGIGNQPVGP